MFQPRGPYFLLSIIKALKKHKPHINFLRAAGLLHSSISFSTLANPKYDLSILFLSPLGGSLVTLTPFYKIETGNLSLGIDVNHILNTLSEFSCIYSIIPSNVGMNDGAK
jgi:hypothetical protein